MTHFRMPLPTYLVQDRFGTFYFRLVIPKQYRHQFPRNKRELRRSLRTTHRPTAIKSARHMWSNFFMSTQITGDLKITDGLESALLKRFFSSYDPTPKKKKVALVIQTPEETAFTADSLPESLHTITPQPNPMNAFALWDQFNRYLSSDSDILRNFEHHDIESAKAYVQEALHMLARIFIAHKHEFLVSPSMSSIRHLYDELIKPVPDWKSYTYVTNHQDQFLIKNVLSNRMCTIDAQMALKKHTKILPFQPAIESLNTDDKSFSIKEIIQKYLAARHPISGAGTEKLASKTYDEYQVMLNLFEKIVGNKPIKKLTRDDIHHYYDLIRNLPKNQNKMPETRNMSLADAIKKAKTDSSIEKISDRTVSKHFDKIRSFLSYARKKQFIEIDYRELLEFKSDPAQSNRYHPFSQKELEILFSKKAYSSTHILQENFAFQFWGPLIALYSGMRMNEVCQLFIEDIREEEGIFVFSVNDNADKTLKTKSSNRVLPVHPILKELGLIKRVEMLRIKNERQFFPNLLPDKHGNRSGKMQRWFPNHLERLGITQKHKVFHSLRSNFADKLKQALVPQELAVELMGHTLNDTFNRHYAQTYNLQYRFKIISALDYSIDFSFLKAPKDNPYISTGLGHL